MNSRRHVSMLAAGAMALALVAPGLASADAPSRLVGIIADFHGKYGLVVRDAQGRVVDVALHQGTIIKPEGLRLERGMQVTILGQASDRTFAAGEIDTPYRLPPAKSHIALTGNDFPVPQANPADAARFGDFPGDRNAPRVTGPLGGPP
jgi:hypothetical protein